MKIFKQWISVLLHHGINSMQVAHSGSWLLPSFGVDRSRSSGLPGSAMGTGLWTHKTLMETTEFGDTLQQDHDLLHG